MKDWNWLTVRLLKMEFHVCTGIAKNGFGPCGYTPQDSFRYDAIKFDEGII